MSSIFTSSIASFDNGSDLIGDYDFILFDVSDGDLTGDLLLELLFISFSILSFSLLLSLFISSFWILSGFFFLGFLIFMTLPSEDSPFSLIFKFPPLVINLFTLVLTLFSSNSILFPLILVLGINFDEILSLT
jgi:hypothetical protein